MALKVKRGRPGYMILLLLLILEIPEQPGILPNSPSVTPLFSFFLLARKLTIVISMMGITFGILKKVVQANNHISFAPVFAAATAAFPAIIITTSTTR